MKHHLRTFVAVLVAAVCVGQPRIGLPQESASGQLGRAESLRALCQKLGIGPGAIIGDIGCGKGQDSFVFASIVGENGAVLAQEIDSGKLEAVLEGAKKRTLPQVVPVLGQSDDPRLPNGLADLIYMHYVFHHFSHPRAMLRKMWFDLKPGGYLAIADRAKGPLRDWASTAEREEKHHWTGETTVVRLAREEGYRFVDALDHLSFEEEAFLLVFQRPADRDAPRDDPDLPSGLESECVVSSLPFLSDAQGVVFVGLDTGRGLLAALRQATPTGTPFFDVVLEEWATSKEELPADPEGQQAEVLRTDQEGLALPADAIVDVVFFADAYHRLWTPATVLKCLRAKMPAAGHLVVVDRHGPDGEPRRLANHRRRISPAVVRQELEKAGFRPGQEGGSAGPDRFLMVFSPDAAAATPLDADVSRHNESATGAPASETEE